MTYQNLLFPFEVTVPYNNHSATTLTKSTPQNSVQSNMQPVHIDFLEIMGQSNWAL